MNKETENLIFKQPEKRSQSQVLLDLCSSDVSLVSEAIISAALYEDDLDFCLNVII